MAITASEARAKLFPLIEQVNNDRMPIEIISKKGSAVLMSLADYEALEETAYLLRTPANAVHLMESIVQHQTGQLQSHELSE
ncbi:type II toxin-antitoxin system Phd/YefM family antitoxin [Arthrobacter sp. Sr24]